MRKSLFVLVMLAGVYSSGFAQFDAGQIIVGGAIGFSTETTKTVTDGNTNTSDPVVNFSFYPRGGYFFSEDMEAGLRIGYNSTSVKDIDSKTVTTRVSVGPYVRKYFDLGDNLYAFGQGAINIGWGKTKNSGALSGSDDNYSSFSLGVSPGLMYRLSDRVALELGVGFLKYSSYNNKDTAADESKTNTFAFDFDLSSLNFGVGIFL